MVNHKVLKRLVVFSAEWLVLQPERLGESRSESLTRPGRLTTPLSLAKDQTEINQIILEASKGSKFYEVRVVDWRFVDNK
jgi:hypothetical protein